MLNGIIDTLIPNTIGISYTSKLYKISMCFSFYFIFYKSGILTKLRQNELVTYHSLYVIDHGRLTIYVHDRYRHW